MRVALAVTLAGALSCASMNGPTSSGAPGEVRIKEGTQARAAGGLMIGAGNFWDEGGQPTCALWISPSQTGERVRKGQVIERDGRRIEVVDVTSEGGKGLVVVKVSPH